MGRLDGTRTIEHERRLCVVDNEIGYFHCWCQSPGVMGSATYGIVEFADRTEEVYPSKVKFIDEVHRPLSYFKEHPEAVSNIINSHN